jgi:hypothetical protein
MASTKYVKNVDLLISFCWVYASSPKVLKEEVVLGRSCLYKIAEGSSL